MRVSKDVEGNFRPIAREHVVDRSGCVLEIALAGKRGTLEPRNERPRGLARNTPLERQWGDRGEAVEGSEGPPIEAGLLRHAFERGLAVAALTGAGRVANPEQTRHERRS